MPQSLSNTSPLYPIMLHLHGRVCVVVGGGAVAERKVAGLVEAGAVVTIVSPALTPALESLVHDGVIHVKMSAYQTGMLDALKPLLVFAATNSPEVNQQVARDARVLGALIDIADDGNTGDFSSMAAVRRGRLTVALSSGGASPALTRRLKQQMEQTIGGEYATLLDWLAALRPVARQQLPDERARRALWQTIIDSRVIDLLRSGDEAGARALLDHITASAFGEHR